MHMIRELEYNVCDSRETERGIEEDEEVDLLHNYHVHIFSRNEE